MTAQINDSRHSHRDGRILGKSVMAIKELTAPCLLIASALSLHSGAIRVILKTIERMD